jgi:hypothetical protein
MSLKGSDIQFPYGTYPVIFSRFAIAHNVIETETVVSCLLKQLDASVGSLPHSQ